MHNTKSNLFEYCYAFLIPKPGNNNILTWEDFRPICIISVLCKLYLKCLQILVEAFIIIDPFIQFGATRGHQACEIVHVLRTILQYANSWGVTVVIFSLDIWKAFDTLEPEAVLDLLETSGVPLRLRLAIAKELAADRQVFLKGPGFETPYIKQFNGLRQGSPESVFLFAGVICMILSKLKNKWNAEGISFEMTFGNDMSFDEWLSKLTEAHPQNAYACRDNLLVAVLAYLDDCYLVSKT